MSENEINSKKIDEYILQFPVTVQSRLNKLRKVIKRVAPKATEMINYQMPTFYLHGNLVHYAAYKNHIGFYPGPSGIKEFEKELSNYKGSKGLVKFPIDKPLPFDLIKEIVAFRVNENTQKLIKPVVEEAE